ncbi:MAG: hypothetical protein ABSG01_16115 [Anaerolineales bacterium]
MPATSHNIPARREVPSPARQADGMSHQPCDEIITLREKVQSLERWRASTEADLKEIRDVISQVKLLITLSIGGGGLSVITLIITISRLIRP